MYTEVKQGNSLSLYFNSLREEEAGKYTCQANYANTEQLKKEVTIEAIGKPILRFFSLKSIVYSLSLY